MKASRLFLFALGLVLIIFFSATNLQMQPGFRLSFSSDNFTRPWLYSLVIGQCNIVVCGTKPNVQRGGVCLIRSRLKAILCSVYQGLLK